MGPIPANVLIFDTTLRDGEQAPGNSLSAEEKLRLARQLDALGVDVIEAGFPAASEGDYRSVREVAAEIRRPVIAALARCHERDIDLAGEAIAGRGAGPDPRLHLDLGPAHPRQAPDSIASRSWPWPGRAVRQARRYTDDVEFSAEDASRTDARLPLPRGRGGHRRRRHHRQPARHRRLCDARRSTPPCSATSASGCPGADAVVLSAHCHDDLGLAVANSLAAIAAGAGQVECTMNGIGERAGNAALEEIVMASQVRGSAPRVPLQRGVAGDLPHQPAALLPDRRLSPAQQGDRGAQRLRPRGRDPPARHAAERAHLRDHPARDGGHSALDPGAGQALRPARARAALPGAGLRADEEQLAEVYREFIALADRKREILDEDLLALLHESFQDAPEEFQLSSPAGGVRQRHARPRRSG